MNRLEAALANGRKKKLKVKPTIKLDIAGGQTTQDGWTCIDIWDGADVVHDLTKYPWPFADGSVSEARCSHYVEHIPMLCQCCSSEVDPLFRFFDELWRILVPEGKCLVIAPYYASMRCWQDPTHRRAISETTFLYSNKKWREDNKLDHYPIKCDFDFGFGYGLQPETISRNEETRQFWIKHYWNVVDDVHVTLTKHTEATRKVNLHA